MNLKYWPASTIIFFFPLLLKTVLATGYLRLKGFGTVFEEDLADLEQKTDFFCSAFAQGLLEL